MPGVSVRLIVNMNLVSRFGLVQGSISLPSSVLLHLTHMREMAFSFPCSELLSPPEQAEKASNQPGSFGVSHPIYLKHIGLASLFLFFPLALVFFLPAALGSIDSETFPEGSSGL